MGRRGPAGCPDVGSIPSAPILLGAHHPRGCRGWKLSGSGRTPTPIPAGPPGAGKGLHLLSAAYSWPPVSPASLRSEPPAR